MSLYGAVWRYLTYFYRTATEGKIIAQVLDGATWIKLHSQHPEEKKSDDLPEQGHQVLKEIQIILLFK